MEVLGKSTIFDDDQVELSVELKASTKEVTKCEKGFYKELSKNNIPGFRKGKAPKEVLEQVVGGHQKACDMIAERIVNEYGIKAIDEEDIIFLEEPSFNMDGEFKSNAPLCFTVSGLIAPEIEVESVDPLEIEMPPDEATEKEIDDYLLDLRDAYHSFKDIDDPNHVLADGDYASIQMTVKQRNGESIKGLEDVERLVGLGKGTMPESFDKHIIGMKLGDTKDFDFDVEVDENNRNNSFGDGKLCAHVEIMKIKEYIIPDLDDEFAQSRGAKDVEDLKKQLAFTINQEKNRELPALMEERVVDAMIKRFNGEIPEYYVNFIRQDVAQEFMRNLENDSERLQEWMLSNDMQKEDIKREVQKEAENRALRDLVLDAFYRQLGLEIDDNDVKKFLKGEENPEEIIKTWTEAKRLADLHKLVRHQKAISEMVKTAKVTVVE